MESFEPGDDLIFQLESGFGLLRVLAVGQHDDGSNVWHLLAYEDLFPDVETAEAALSSPERMRARIPHMALTDRAFERTPAAKIGNRPLNDAELAPYRDWLNDPAREISDRSALLMLGLR